MKIPTQQILLVLLVMNSEQCAEAIYSEIKPEMLEGINKKIYEKCLSLHQHGEVADLITLASEPTWVDHILSAHNLNMTLRVNYSGTDEYQVKSVIRDVQRQFVKRQMKNLVQSMNGLVEADAPVWEIFQQIDEVRGKLDNSEKSNFRSLAEIIDETGTEEAFEELSTSCLKTRDWHKFDRNIIIKPTDFIILAGRPSMGKTDFALQWTKQLATNGQPVAFFSLETQGEYLNRRFAPGSSYEEFQQQCALNAHLPIYIDDSPVHNAYTIASQVKYAKRTYGIKAVFLDYLTLLDANEGDNRNIQIENLSKALKRSANTNQIPHIVLAQLSRKVESRPNKRPILSDLRDSGGIEQNIDIALFLYRDSYYQKLAGEEETEPNKLEVIAAKQRDGATGATLFDYDRAKKIIKPYETLNSPPMHLYESAGF